MSCLEARKHNAIDAVLDQYFAQLAGNHQIDFELILRYAYELLAANPTISILLSSLFSCILVDEYQDTKEIQYAIIASILKAGGGGRSEPLSSEIPNQAIYGSLGGYAITREELQAITGIELKQLELSRNYRSSERIIGYFGNYNEHVMAVVAAAEHKDYGKLDFLRRHNVEGQS